MSNPDLWDGSLLKDSDKPKAKSQPASKRRKGLKQSSVKQAILDARWAGIREATIYWLNRLDPDGAHCMECGRKARRLDLDHIVPRSKGGHYSVSNAQLLCRECHSRRHGVPEFGRTDPVELGVKE